MESNGKIALSATKVFQGRTNIPTNFVMLTEGGASIGGGSVGDDLGAHGGDRSAVEIELTEQGGMNRE